MKINLCSVVTTEYSIEAGKADNLKHFDHHGDFSDMPAPCNNNSIAPNTQAEVTITHLDADTLVGIMRLNGIELPSLDFQLMERIDLNGSSIIEDLYDATLLWMVGVGAICRAMKFPFCKAESVDVTEQVEILLSKTTEEIIAEGKKAQDAVEDTYSNCVISKDAKAGVILFSVGADDAFDPSRPYRDGFDRVIVYREHYESISIYCSPKSDFGYGGQTIANVVFAGHLKACGSPRGVAMTLEDAHDVYNAIVA